MPGRHFVRKKRVLHQRSLFLGHVVIRQRERGDTVWTMTGGAIFVKDRRDISRIIGDLLGGWKEACAGNWSAQISNLLTGLEGTQSLAEIRLTRVRLRVRADLSA